jgi:hypothetical protein
VAAFVGHVVSSIIVRLDNALSLKRRPASKEGQPLATHSSGSANIHRDLGKLRQCEIRFRHGARRPVIEPRREVARQQMSTVSSVAELDAGAAVLPRRAPVGV